MYLFIYNFTIIKSELLILKKRIKTHQRGVGWKKKITTFDVTMGLEHFFF